MVFEKSKWIRADKGCEAPMFRKEFDIDKFDSAEINICGLGFFELYINGKRVSDELLIPVWSDYEKREFSDMLYPVRDSFTYRTYYKNFDITDYVEEGRNTIGVVLGNGWYNQNMRVEEGKLSYGAPKLCYELFIKSGSTVTAVVSDENDMWAESSVIKNNIFYGEVHDARMICDGWNKSGFEASNWKKPEIISKETTNLTLQECPSDKRCKALKPVCIYRDAERKLYDMGENNTAWVKIEAFGERGEEIKVRYAEEINDDKTLNFDSTGKERQIQSDLYICDGEKRFFEPRFSVRAFRYFEVCGNGVPVECTVIHSDIDVIASFETDDEILNWIFNAYIRTQLANMHYGVPTDCPHRERLGYTGDGQVTSDSAMLLLDAKMFYKKWIQDIIDGQDLNSGHIQHTAPFYGGGGGPGGWGGAIVFVPYNYYKHYADIEILKRAYPAMKGWARYMESHSEGGLVVREEEGGWCLGEWATPEPIAIPEPFVNSYFFVKGLTKMKEIAEVLGQNEDISEYEKKIIEVKKAICSAYYDSTTGSFCGGTQGGDAFALDIGLGDSRTLSNLVKKYTKLKGFDTGIFGVDILTEVLFNNGFNDLAHELLTSENAASFRYQKEHGATTLWEFWSGLDSHSHPMFGATVKNFIYSILGIRQKENTYGFQKVIIEPHFIKSVNKACGKIRTVSGDIEIKYIKNEKEIEFEVHADCNISAEVVIEGKSYNVESGERKLKISH